MNLPPQTILRLKLSNFLRLSAVDITPAPGEHVITIGGGNGAGKTSVLDGISSTLGGAAFAPDQPIKEGEEIAVNVLETQDLIVTRRFTAAGSTVVIKSKADAKAKYGSPQELLDGFFGALGFDPAAFQRAKPEKQREILQELLGLNFDDIDAKEKELYDNRTAVGRDRDKAKAAADAIATQSAPEKEQSISELSVQFKAAQANNREQDKLKTALANGRNTIKQTQLKIVNLGDQIDDLQLQREAAYETLKTQESVLETVIETLGEFQVIAEVPILAAMESLEQTNSRVRSNTAKLAHHAEYEKHAKAYDEFTAGLAYLEKKKTQAIKDAKFPVPGLSFAKGGVLLNGKPFSQASTAEQIRVSVAMGMALNPNLKVILIRDGSLLDSTSFAIIESLAQQHGYQIWVEVVTDGPGDEAECTVVIEDGAVKSS